MTATIRAHAEMTIAPEATVPHYAISRDHADETRRGREFAVYLVPSRTSDAVYRVVHNARLRVLYCDCTAAQFGNVCGHLQAVLFHRHYLAHYRLWHAATLPELQAKEADYRAIERGRHAKTRGWRAEMQAIGELVRERTIGEAA